MKKTILVALMAVVVVNAAKAKVDLGDYYKDRLFAKIDNNISPRWRPTIFDALDHATHNNIGQINMVETPDFSQQNAPDFSAQNKPKKSKYEHKRHYPSPFV